MAGWGVLHCSKCHDTMASEYRAGAKFVWSLRLGCGKCKTKWWVCTICKRSRSQLLSRSHLTRHHATKHRDDDDIYEPPSQPVVLPQPKAAIPKKYFGRPESVEYFNAVEDCTGARHLVSLAVDHKEVIEAISDDSIDMMMTTAHFISNLSWTQREEFAAVLEKTVSITTKIVREETSTSDMKPAASPSINLPVPRTKQQLRSIFCEGKKAILPNLPHPSVKVKDDHAYLLPSECIADFMAHGVTDAIQKPRRYPEASHSRRPSPWTITTSKRDRCQK